MSQIVCWSRSATPDKANSMNNLNYAWKSVEWHSTLTLQLNSGSTLYEKRRRFNTN